MKRTILIDDDNVTNCWDGISSAPRMYIERITGKPWIPLAKLEKWDLTEPYGKEFRGAIEELLHKPPKGFYYNIEPMEGALEVIPRLIKKYNVRFVTTPIYDPADIILHDKKYLKLWWRILQEKSHRLHNWFGHSCPQILGEYDKTLIAGDVLIDDNPKAGVRKARSPLWKQILFDRNYLLNTQSNHQFKADWFTCEEEIEKVFELSNLATEWSHKGKYSFDD